MTLTLLLDLDGTLLNTNVDTFIPAYFQALSNDLAPHISPDLMMRALLSGMRLMNESEDSSRTLRQVFEEEFYPKINMPIGALERQIERFYDEVFPTLEHITSQNPDAKPFVDWALSQGFRIAVATDPLLPTKATYQRLRWAGFEPEQFQLVSTYDHFHFSKTHPAYYAEVLGRMGWRDGPVLMIGDDMDRDILPAKRLGLATYHIVGDSASKSAPEAEASGRLSDLRPWLESTDLSSLVPSYKSIDSAFGILSSTPAVLNQLLRGIAPSRWSFAPSAEDWSLTEVICHFRDTEREIHQMQINLFREQAEPFIPRPDTNVWASERDYRHEDGADALIEFNRARGETLLTLHKISKEDWSQKARHAIFGPTNFLEVVSFIAEHDRMHIYQIWSALKKLQ